MTTNLLWSNLESTLDNIINQFEGVAGLSIRWLNNNKTISINGDNIFPTASSIKIHILTQLFTLEDKGTIDLAKRVRFTQDMYGAGSGVIHFLENEPEFTILDIAILMMLVSDNTATNMCIDLAGMQETNNLIKDLGLSKTKLGRKMMDPDAINAAYSPRECPATNAGLFEVIDLSIDVASAAMECTTIAGCVLIVWVRSDSGPSKQIFEILMSKISLA